MATDIQKINEQVGKQLANKETLATLVATTFKGLEQANIKQAMVEAYMRGFTFEDFLQKNIYAIPFIENKGKPNERQTYSLVTSIDYARKIGMKNGVVGVSKPTFEVDDKGAIISCSVTVKRKIGKEIGEFTSEVYFKEYSTGQNQWTKRPRTMIVKVATMHALRAAAPEALAQMYTADEMGEKSTEIGRNFEKVEPIDVSTYSKKLEACTSISDLSREWSALPFEVKGKLVEIKDKKKVEIEKAIAEAAQK